MDTRPQDALLFPAAGDENQHMAPATLYKVYYPARKAVRKLGGEYRRRNPRSLA